MEFFSQGNLAAIWAKGEAPEISEKEIRRVYSEHFRPGAETDARRLHRVLEAGIVTKGKVSFYDYSQALVSFKANMGGLALPDLGKTEVMLDELCLGVTEGRIYDSRKAVRDMIEECEFLSLAPSEPGYLKARFACILYDSSLACKDIAQKMVTDHGRALLYEATLRGPEAVEDLITQDWMNRRRTLDIDHLREKLLKCAARYKLDERVKKIEQSQNSGDSPRPSGGTRVRIV